MKRFRTDEGDRSFLVVLANAFAEGRSAGPCPGDEMVTLNHFRGWDDRESHAAMARESLRFPNDARRSSIVSGLGMGSDGGIPVGARGKELGLREQTRGMF